MLCLARLVFLYLLLVRTDGAGGFFWGGSTSSRGASGSEGDRKERSFDRKQSPDKSETGSMSSRSGRSQGSRSYFSEVTKSKQLRIDALTHGDQSSSISINVSS